MKTILKTLAAWLLLGASPAMAVGPTYGLHGMALFGGQPGLYASHLPMFHTPHDYQVILQVRLADKAQDAALRARLDGNTTMWSVAPEKFDLARLAKGSANPLASFRADMVEGHFEQGGRTQFANAMVIVEKVLFFKRLDPRAAARKTARYLQVGSGARRYLVKEVDSRPDFDHIVAIAASPQTGRGDLSVEKHALNETPAAELARVLPGIAVVGSVYYETADLK
ncbi:MAG: hypothetical protein V4633_16795 [Pseudomonadota bacterium]